MSAFNEIQSFQIWVWTGEIICCHIRMKTVLARQEPVYMLLEL